jgi:hypothetical protein
MGDIAALPMSKRWNYWVLSFVFAGSLFFQIQTLCIFCRCWKSAWEVSQCNAALVFDGVVLGRIVLSLVFRERNQKWIVWSVMCALSPFWISWIFDLAWVLLGRRYGL